MKKAIFLDRDGTVIDNIPYNADPAKVRLAPVASEALYQMRMSDYLLILISNQSGVALGYFTECDVHAINIRVAELLAQGRVALDGAYCCPHHEAGVVAGYAAACDCRKPKPGLILQAAKDHGIDLPASWMIGDILDDVEAGLRAGCKTILIDNGNETVWKQGFYRTPHYVVKDLLQAAGIIEQTVSNEILAGL